MKTRSFSQLKPLILGTLLCGTTVLSGCSTPQTSHGPVASWSDIQIAESVERLELYARPDGLSLSARDETAVAQFLQDYGRFGDGPLYINMPGHVGAQRGALATQTLIRRLMSDVGLHGAPIQTGQYQTAPRSPAPVIVSYRRLKTLPADCSRAGDLVHSYNNQPYDGFGCSYYANLAAMIQDPRQLLEPYDFAPSDMKRRMTVYDKYIKGENPASEHPDRQEISAEQE